MNEWEGFATLECDVDADRPRLQISADFAGPDEDPKPLALLIQRSARPPDGSTRQDIIELTEAELAWLVEQAAAVLDRMRARP